MTDESIITLAKSEKLTSVKAIYKYLYDTFIENRVTEEQKSQIRKRFENLPCLWDESTNRFWKPIHAFEDDVSFFGNRRVTIPFSHRIGEVYHLLGQKRSPTVDDYVVFLQELAEEYKNRPLSEEDKTYAIQVLTRLESQLSLEERTIKNIPLLTADCQLHFAEMVFIPDAPWRKNYIQPYLLLHPQVSVKLAQSAGSLSLLKDVIENPKEVNPVLNTPSNSWCQQWQKTLNSLEFIFGLKRLIFHQNDFEPILDIIWLKSVKVSPASQIKVDLLLNDNIMIAAEIPGSYYFDGFNRILHITATDNKVIMLYYLAEMLNNQLGKYRLQNLLPLAVIVDTETHNINRLLNDLKIRDLPETIELTSNNLTEKWVENFYRWLGYTNIKKSHFQEGFDFICNGLDLSEVKVKVEFINFQSSIISLPKNAWTKMLESKDNYDLVIIICPQETIEEIIYFSNIWNSLNYAESIFQNKFNYADKNHIKQEREFLVKFSEDTNDNIIINWQRLVQTLDNQKFKRYQPILCQEIQDDAVTNIIGYIQI